MSFVRSDGVEGFGFEIQHAGKLQYSVAWPDMPSTRHTKEEAERMEMKCIEHECLSEESDFEDEGESEQVSRLEQLLENSESEVSRLTELNVELSARIEQLQLTVEVDPEVEVTAGTTEEVLTTEGIDSKSEADLIRAEITADPTATNKSIIAKLAEAGVTVSSSQVTRYKNELAESE